MKALRRTALLILTLALLLPEPSRASVLNEPREVRTYTCREIYQRFAENSEVKRERAMQLAEKLTTLFSGQAGALFLNPVTAWMYAGLNATGLILYLANSTPSDAEEVVELLENAHFDLLVQLRAKLSPAEFEQYLLKNEKLLYLEDFLAYFQQLKRRYPDLRSSSLITALQWGLDEGIFCEGMPDLYSPEQITAYLRATLDLQYSNIVPDCQLKLGPGNDEFIVRAGALEVTEIRGFTEAQRWLRKLNDEKTCVYWEIQP